MKKHDTDKIYHQRWWIIGVALIGTWVGTLGNSMIPVALPTILGFYRTPLNSGVWIVSVYVLMVAVLMPLFGWIGDRYGYRRIYLAGLSGFAFFSWAAVFAPSFNWLLLFRVCQGICNATTLPSVMGIISQIFPKNQRGRAMGAWAAVNGAAHGLGPVISGLLVQAFNWQALFWFNGFVTMVGIVLIWYLVPPDNNRHTHSFDWLGAVTFTVAVLSLMLNITQGRRLGWGSGSSMAMWALFLVLLTGFVFAEKRVHQPFVALRLFVNRGYSAVVAASAAQFFCLMGFQIMLPLYLIDLRGASETAAGLVVSVLASTLALCSPWAGRVADRRGYRFTMICGMAAVAAVTAGMVFWTKQTPMILMVLMLTIIGLGMGFTQSPAAAGITLLVPKKELGVALGIFNMMRFIGATLGATISGVVLNLSATGAAIPITAFRNGFLLLTVIAAVAAVISGIRRAA